MSARAAIGFLLAGSIGVGLAGCASPVATPSLVDGNSEQQAYLVQLESAIESAEKDQASKSQIDLLTSSREDGYLSYDIAHDALMHYASCLGDHGVGFREESTSGPPEFPHMEYVVSIYTSEDETWWDYCYAREFEKVDVLYQLQPRAARARNDLIDSHRDELLACLASAGLPLPTDASVDEIRQEVFFALAGFYPGSNSSAPPPGFESADCLGPAGLSIDDLNE